MKCSLGISNFLEISSLSHPISSVQSLSRVWLFATPWTAGCQTSLSITNFHSIVFLYLFALITEEGFPILAILWNSAFKWVYLSFSPLPFTSLLFSAICKSFSDNHFTFLHFFFFGMVLITAFSTVLWTSIHSSSCTLSDLIPWIYLPITVYNHA